MGIGLIELVIGRRGLGIGLMELGLGLIHPVIWGEIIPRELHGVAWG